MDAPKCRTCGEKHWGRVCNAGKRVESHEPRQARVQPVEGEKRAGAKVAVRPDPPPYRTAANAPAAILPGKPDDGRLSGAEIAKARFDKVSYQREYMKGWRARQKLKNG